MTKTSIIILIMFAVACRVSAQTPLYSYNPATDFYSTLPTDTSLVLRMLAATDDYTAYQVKNAKTNEIDSMCYLDPLSLVFIIAEDGEKERPDSASAISFQLQKQFLKEQAGPMRLSGQVAAKNVTEQQRLNTEILQLMWSAIYRKHNFESRLPNGLLDSLLTSSGKRYALVTLQIGYVRTPQNLKHYAGRHLAHDIHAGFSGVVMKRPVPESAFEQASSSHFFTMIIDTKEHKTYHFRHYGVFHKKASALDKSLVENQYKRAFTGLFWK